MKFILCALPFQLGRWHVYHEQSVPTIETNGLFLSRLIIDRLFQPIW